jgi:putative addiction module killer protein
MEAQPREVRNYRREDGKSPFEDWLSTLRERDAKAKIKARLRRVSLGNLGDYKSVGDGVCELRVDWGSGYRVYFGQTGKTVVLLLCGGDKSTQNQDIRRAKEYWADYEKREDADE